MGLYDYNVLLVGTDAEMVTQLEDAGCLSASGQEVGLSIGPTAVVRAVPVEGELQAVELLMDTPTMEVALATAGAGVIDWVVEAGRAGGALVAAITGDGADGYLAELGMDGDEPIQALVDALRGEPLRVVHPVMWFGTRAPAQLRDQVRHALPDVSRELDDGSVLVTYVEALTAGGIEIYDIAPWVADALDGLAAGGS